MHTATTTVSAPPGRAPHHTPDMTRGSARKAPPRASSTPPAGIELRTSELHPDDQELIDSGVKVVRVALYTRDTLDGPEPRARRICRPR